MAAYLGLGIKQICLKMRHKGKEGQPLHFEKQQTTLCSPCHISTKAMTISTGHRRRGIATILSLVLCHSAASNSGPTEDLFTFSCLPLTTQRSDPIMSPGKPSSHTHVVVGGTAFQRLMTTDTARNANDTTCEVAIDRSNYWIPQLYHQTRDGFETIEFENSVCYKL